LDEQGSGKNEEKYSGDHVVNEKEAMKNILTTKWF
jgi:hypothetical protein